MSVGQSRATGKELCRITLPVPWPPAPPMVTIRGCPFGGFGLGLALSPDGKLVASPVTPWLGEQTPTTLRLWETASGKEIRRIALTPEHGFDNFTFASDGRMLAVENWDRTVTLWEVASGKERARLGTIPPAAQLAPALQTHASFVGGVDTPAIAFAPDGRTLAVKDADSSIRMWDVRAGKERSPLKGHQGTVTALAFSPDSKILASAAGDTTILLWDIADWSRELQAPAGELPAKEIDSLWADLAGEDAAKAFQGICKLTGTPRQAIPLLRARLRPAAPVDIQKIRKWVADLDSDDFAVRQQAERELEKLGELAVPALSKLKAEPPSLETRRRAERLLERVTAQALTAEQLRLVRALEVLEQINTAEARRLLEELAKGAPGALLTREAQAALERLARRPLTPP